MKFIKNNIKIFIIIIITAILCSSISVYATYSYLAKDVSYIPSNDEFKVDNVEDALNELYELKKTSNIDFKNAELLYNYNSGGSFSGSYEFDGKHDKAIVLIFACSRDNNVLVNCDLSGGTIVFDKTLYNRLDVYSYGRLLVIDDISNETKINYNLRWQPGILIYGL